MMLDHFDDADEELLYEGAQCSRCDLDLDPQTGYCPNSRCPFHCQNQDEIVRWSPPGDDKRSLSSRCVRDSSTARDIPGAQSHHIGDQLGLVARAASWLIGNGPSVASRASSC